METEKNYPNTYSTSRINSKVSFFYLENEIKYRRCYNEIDQTWSKILDGDFYIIITPLNKYEDFFLLKNFNLHQRYSFILIIVRFFIPLKTNQITQIKNLKKKICSINFFKSKIIQLSGNLIILILIY